MSNKRKMNVGSIVYVWGINTSKIYKCSVIDVAPVGAKTPFPYTVTSLGVVDIDGNLIETDSGEFNCSESAIWSTAKDAYNCEYAVEGRQFRGKFDILDKEINNVSDLLKFPIKHNLTDTDRDDVAYAVYKKKAKELFGIDIM